MTMAVEEISRSGVVTMRHYRCSAGPDTATETELHHQHVLAFVTGGTFGYRVSGRTYEMVPGSILIGEPGRAFACTHDHHETGDTCVCFHFSDDALVEEGIDSPLWKLPMLPALPPTAIFGEVAHARIGGHTDLGHDEVGYLLAGTASEIATDKELSRVQPSARDRRLAIECALRIDEHYDQTFSLDQLAKAAGMSPFHFLRVFTHVVGTTPHQYLVRMRLRRATWMLAGTTRTITDIAFSTGFGDLSNFFRTFGRAAGMSPRNFRRALRRDGSFLRELTAKLS